MKSSQYRNHSYVIFLKIINSRLLLGISAHESITAINITLKILQYEISLKHENFSIKSHYLQLLHFRCYSSKTLHRINNVTFTKIKVS